MIVNIRRIDAIVSLVYTEYNPQRWRFGMENGVNIYVLHWPDVTLKLKKKQLNFVKHLLLHGPSPM